MIQVFFFISLPSMSATTERNFRNELHKHNIFLVSCQNISRNAPSLFKHTQSRMCILWERNPEQHHEHHEGEKLTQRSSLKTLKGLQRWTQSLQQGAGISLHKICSRYNAELLGAGITHKLNGEDENTQLLSAENVLKLVGQPEADLFTHTALDESSSSLLSFLNYAPHSLSSVLQTSLLERQKVERPEKK